jgi:Leucine-rich repeat (LRR) protein
MNENPSPFLDGANKLEDIIEYSDDRHKVTFGSCDFDVFLEEYSIDDSVEIMFVSECKFSDLTFLGQLPNLKEFYIDYPYENFVSLTDLKSCFKLEKLVAVNCRIKKIEGLADLINLESLTLFINEIPKIQGIETLTR